MSLIPGTYKLTVERQGFDRSVTDQVIVQASQTTTVNTALRVGAVSATVEVIASSATLSTTSPDVATTVQRDLLGDIPYTERNALEAAMLVPRVRRSQQSRPGVLGKCGDLHRERRFTVQGITLPYINQTNAVPYVQQWGFTTQFQVDSKTMAQVGYSGTVGTHLISIASPPLKFPNLATLDSLISKGANFSPTNIPNPTGLHRMAR